MIHIIDNENKTGRAILIYEGKIVLVYLCPDCFGEKCDKCNNTGIHSIIPEQKYNDVDKLWIDKFNNFLNNNKLENDFWNEIKKIEYNTEAKTDSDKIKTALYLAAQTICNDVDTSKLPALIKNHITERLLYSIMSAFDSDNKLVEEIINLFKQEDKIEEKKVEKKEKKSKINKKASASFI